MSDVKQQTRVDVEAEAKSLGLVLFTPLPHELFIDLDGDAVLNWRVLERIKEATWTVDNMLETISKSGNKHVYLRIAFEVNPTEAAALQAALGSDPLKEYLTIMQIRSGCGAPIALFEKPHQAERVTEWRKIK